jgi:hypothetical protein
MLVFTYLLSNAEYVKNHGQKCPQCGGAEIEGGTVEVLGGFATQEISCGDCGASWLDNYNLIGFTDLTKGEGV